MAKLSMDASPSKSPRIVGPADEASDQQLLPPGSALDAFSLEYNYVCRTLRRLGGNEADIEDLAHEVFLVLYKKWGEYDPQRPLRPYLFGITFRIAASHRRRRRRELPGVSQEVADRAPRPDQMLWAQQARALVLSALQRVPLPRRAVLVMHDLDETPMSTVADILQIPLFTAYSRLRKGRKEFEAAIKAVRRSSP